MTEYNPWVPKDVIFMNNACILKLSLLFMIVWLSGRPEKLPDVCYSWWVLASLKILGKVHWIDKVAKEQNKLSCLYKKKD